MEMKRKRNFRYRVACNPPSVAADVRKPAPSLSRGLKLLGREGRSEPPYVGCYHRMVQRQAWFNQRGSAKRPALSSTTPLIVPPPHCGQHLVSLAVLWGRRSRHAGASQIQVG